MYITSPVARLWSISNVITVGEAYDVIVAGMRSGSSTIGSNGDPRDSVILSKLVIGLLNLNSRLKKWEFFC